MNIAWLIALVVVLAYVYPVSVLPLMGLPQAALYMLVLPVVTLVAVVGSRQGPELRIPVLVFLLLTSVGMVASADVAHSAARWLGLATLLAVIGPLLYSPYLARLRLTVWKVALAVLVALTLISFVWWAVGAASVGRGAFSGVWNHSMLLGPLAAVAAIWAYVRTIERRSGLLGAILAICIFTCVLSASRAALFALALGIVFASLILLRRRYYFLYMMFIGVVFLGGISFVAHEMYLRPLPEHVQMRVVERGFSTDSRESLWRTRVNEFRSEPITGVGFAVQQSDGFEPGVAIEPGSSYLALGAQTGLLGALGFVVFGASGVVAFWRRRRRLEPFQCSVLVGIGTMFLAHQFFEGYLLAVGSILAFLFWLWAGVSLDRLREVDRPDDPRQRLAQAAQLADEHIHLSATT